MNIESKKFIRNASLFVLVLILSAVALIGLPAYIFWKSGEWIGVDRVVEMQKDSRHQLLYGDAYTDSAKVYKLYKLKLVKSKDCEVLALGTSRVVSFRDHFFNVSFCNAGMGVRYMSEFEPFMEQILDENKPDLLIIGLDQDFFNSATLDQDKRNLPASQKEENVVVRFQVNLPTIYKDLFSGKINMSLLSYQNPGRIGLNAIIQDYGFRNDGSYHYGPIVSGNNHSSRTVLSKIKKGQDRFKIGDDVSDSSLKDLEALLIYCKSHNITVVGFLPPYAQEVWDIIEEKDEKYGYMFKIEPAVSPIFKKYGFRFYDFSDLKSINASSCEALNGNHASEKAYLRILIEFVKNDRNLEKYADLDYLEDKLNRSKGCFLTAEI